MSREEKMKSIDQGRALGDKATEKIFNNEIQRSLDMGGQIAYAVAILGRSLAVIDHLIGDPQVDKLIKALRDSVKSAPENETIQ